MVLSEAIHVMLVTLPRWQGFTDRPICPPDSSEVSLAMTCNERAEVDRLIDAGTAAGGKADVNPPEDHGFMYQRTIADPDGHLWEPFWMDQAATTGNPETTDEVP
jgi:hypothetical protein